MTTIVTSNPAKYIALAKTLPRKLQRFLARYPSPQIVKPGATPTHYQTATENPFLVSTNQYTGKLQKPVYSLRRQADLVKAARKYGIEELLPYSTKKTEVRLAHKVKYGSRVKGTGVGQSVKGRLHERRLGVKYVHLFSLPVAWRWRVKAIHCANLVLQDGQEESCYAQDAGTHQGMESGMLIFDFYPTVWLNANDSCRLENGTGPNGPKRQHSVRGPSPLHRDVQPCIKYLYQSKKEKENKEKLLQSNLSTRHPCCLTRRDQIMPLC